MAIGNPKADIPLFYGDSTLDNVSAKFLLDRIRIVPTTYGWTDETTAGNFKLALRGKEIDGLIIPEIHLTSKGECLLSDYRMPFSTGSH